MGTGQLGLASLFAALGLVALVPAVCVLWFMTVAMRNERLAVQDRLTNVYLTHLASLRSQLTVFWTGRQAALATTAADSPGQRFAALVRDGLVDGAVVSDAAGKVLYPATALNVETSVVENADWVRARELEFQKNAATEATAAYAHIAQASENIQAKARALQAQVACLLRAGEKEAALRVLANLTGDSALRGAVSAQGALIVPNAQLLVLKTLRATVPREESSSSAALQPALETAEARAEAPRYTPATGHPSPPPPARRQQTLDDLIARLNDYADAAFSSSQRRFLMREVQALAPEAAHFPTLAAEELAAAYLEHDPAPPTEAKLQRTPIATVWRLPSADRTVVALLREERLQAEMGTRLAALALPYVRVTILPPGETIGTARHLPPQDAGELLPGWRLALSFRNGDPLAEASARQSRFYLWTGFFVVVIIALLAWLVARYVAAQMRLARLKNELVSAVSHELKTPLASIRALVDTLSADRYRDEQQLREYLQLIARENLRLTHLIENFLTFSRLERGKERFHFEDLAPESIVAAAVAAVREKLQAPECQFTQLVAPDLPRLHGDTDALTTVLINLLDNACKYTGDEKRITVRAHADSRHVCFEVEDNGIGLAPDEVRRIFDRFYQVDQSLTRQRGGCGLGLSIVKFIVEAHHGSVDVTSTPGQGSTFRVRIPMATPNAERSTPNSR